MRAVWTRREESEGLIKEPACPSNPSKQSVITPPYDLAIDLDGLRTALLAQIYPGDHAFDDVSSLQVEGSQKQAIDRYLMVVGINQILEDYLHRDDLELRHVAERLARGPSFVRLVGARVLTELATGVQSVRSQSYERRIARWQSAVARLVECLANDVVDPTMLVGQARRASFEAARKVLADMEGAPAKLLRTVVRLPACFVTFDQRPADCHEIARDFASRWPNRQKPLALIGVRTSGSYLAPIFASYLRQEGFRDITVLTWRPGQRWLPHEVRKLREVVNVRPLALVADDPPTSGTALSKAADALEAIGFPNHSIILLLQLFESSAWPWSAKLSRYESVRLPSAGWSIQRQLSSDVVKETLTKLLVGRMLELERADGSTAEVAVGGVKAVQRLPRSEKIDPRVRRSPRRHISALYKVQLIDEFTGESFSHHIYAKGIGLGYLGAQSMAIADRLGDYVPRVYGTADGLIFRSWLPEEGRLADRSPGAISEAAHSAAEYVASRQRALPVPQDTSQRLVGRDAIWEQAGHVLSGAFGRAAPLARILLRGKFERLLPTSKPSVVDGSMGPYQWFVERPNRLAKVDFDENIFWRATPACYDAAFDLASAAVEFEANTGCDEGPTIGKRLREAYRAAGGERIDDERWLVYQLLHLRKCRQRFLHDYELSQTARSLNSKIGANDDDSTEIVDVRRGVQEALGPLERDMSRVLARYLGDIFLGDTRPAGSGPIWAIDIDGVLETGNLSFPSITPAGLLALRALLCHGYRVVLASGRSLGEIRERCQAYRLAGGVAEYGAVVYDSVSNAARSLLDEQQRSGLARIRRLAESMEGIYVDPAFEDSVRCYRLVAGQRSGLAEGAISDLLAKSGAGDRVRPIRGRNQSDFAAAYINKATGLAVLMRELDGTSSSKVRTLAAAVGDTAEDLPMLGLAELRFAPANADRLVRSHSSSGSAPIALTKHSHQTGLQEAVSRVVGHRAGGCATCRVPKLSSNAAFLVNMLAAQDLGRRGKINHLLKLAIGARR
jgi:hydroxymethylpyrimidine pyrophosphatase-like HAD family hydrolase